MNRLSILLTWGREVLLCTATAARHLASIPAATAVTIPMLLSAPVTTIKPTRDLVQKTPRPWPLLLSINIIIIPTIAPDNSIRGTKSRRTHVIIIHSLTIRNAILPRKITSWNLATGHKLLTWEVIERQIFNGIDMNENLKHMRLLHFPGPHKVYLHTTSFRL
jgi:hypothetical protein